MEDTLILRKKLNSSVGIELKNIGEVAITEEGYFLYKGQRVLLYIRDQYYNPNHPESEYKYHICNCDTIQETIKNDRFNRYVVSTRIDGLFKINVRHSHTRKIIKENKVKQLHVCKNCLLKLRYHGYSDHRTAHGIYYEFDLATFFSEYSEQTREKPNFNDQNAPKDDYSTYFTVISARFREFRKWTCEICGRCFEKRKNFIDTHHKNGLKSDDRPENFECLCVECHSKKPNHSHIMESDRYKQFMKYTRGKTA